MKKLSRCLLRAFFPVMVSVAFSSCSQEEAEHGFRINGVWELQYVTSPDGTVCQYSDGSNTWLRIYDDSCYYACQVATAPNGTMINPAGAEPYTYIYKGNNEILYLQGNDTHPLTIVNDSMMVIQEMGRKYTWLLCQDFDQERSREIVDVIKTDASNGDDIPFRYVFSTAEKKLETTNHALIYTLLAVIAALMLLGNYARNLQKNKKRVEQQLRQIQQERESMPEPVRQAMSTVEEEFHKSEFYVALRRRIANAERLKKDDWEAIEMHFKSVYPRFISTLFSLYSMSQVEYQVCILLKLHATPSEIAGVLCKDTSSISSTRSRLYQKVFGKKGSSRDWDEFIYSL